MASFSLGTSNAGAGLLCFLLACLATLTSSACGRTDLLAALPGRGDGGDVQGVATSLPCTAEGFVFAGLIPAVLFEHGASALVMGDVNGDGKTDMVATLELGDTVAVALGIGDGTFVQGSRSKTGSAPATAVIADFDGDGNADLATANRGADSVSILLGVGHGQFRDKVDYPTVAKPFELVVVSGGAARGDLVVRGSAELQRLVNRGDGSFVVQPAFGATGHSQASHSTMAMADMNGDGRDDLVVAHGDFQFGLSVFAAGSDGRFADATSFFTEDQYQSVAVADLDGDGRNDLVCTGYSFARVFISRGDGSFTEKQTLSSSGVVATVGDVNGDGRPDLLVPDDESRWVRISLNRGDGNFEDVEPCRQADEGGFVASGDLNGDKRADLVMPAWDGVVDIALAQPGGFQAVETGVPAYSYVFEDLDHDGRLDIAGGYSGGLTVWLAQKDQTFSDFAHYSIEGAVHDVEKGDVNGDGNVDLLVQTTDLKSLGAYLGRGDGTFAAPVYTQTPPETEVGAVADLNHDGRADWIGWTRFASRVGVWLGRGDGTFLPASDYQAGGSPSSVAVGDLNGDGHPDICAVTSDGKLGILPGQGDGTFAAPVVLTPTGSVESYSMHIADVNGDGLPDLLATTSQPTSLGVVLGRSDGGFGVWVESPAAFQSGMVMDTGDVDGDGRMDVGVWDWWFRFHVMLGQGDGRLKQGPIFLPSPDRLADFDGDGRPDLGAVEVVNGVLRWRVWPNRRCVPPGL